MHMFVCVHAGICVNFKRFYVCVFTHVPVANGHALCLCLGHFRVCACVHVYVCVYTVSPELFGEACVFVVSVCVYLPELFGEACVFVVLMVSWPSPFSVTAATLISYHDNGSV